MIDPRVMARLRKVLALVLRGEDGERAAAEHQLDILLRKFGLTIEDLDDGAVEVKRYRFERGDERAYALFCQILHMVFERKAPPVFTLGRIRKYIHVDMTAAQHAEVTATYSVMHTALQKEMDLVLLAFMVANSLFPAPIPTEPGKAPEDLTADQMRVLAMASVMPKNSVFKTIGCSV